MAVVQISRIQVRRGQANQGAGLPQLASGEFGWAIDTRELYIGNGSVSEGAPAIGNTKILTQFDDIFSLAGTYSYRVEDSYIQTGESSVSPVRRTLQDRLDDRVSVRSFGLTGDSGQNATVLLQRAIDQLFLNSANKTNRQSRVVLYLEPGTYTIDNVIYIPPFVNLVGAGPDKTVISQTSANPIFQTVNGDSTPGNPALSASTTYNNQCRNIHIENISLESTQNNIGLFFDNCRESILNNVKILGPWTVGDSIPTGFTSGIGIKLDSLSGVVESSNNKFIDCSVQGWTFGVMSNWDINNTIFDRCTFSDLGYGMAYGVDMILDGDPATGRSVGPQNTVVSDSKFDNIARYAIWIEEGTNNVSNNNQYTSVGNEGGTEGDPAYPIIKFSREGNISNQDYFSRTANLSYNPLYINTIEYVPEIEGIVDYTDNFTRVLEFGQTGTSSGIKLFRLPGFANQTFELDYQLLSLTYESQRVGKIIISTEKRGTPTISITDDYTYVGDTTYEDSVSFTAYFEDLNFDLVNDTVSVNVISLMPSNDTSQIKFTVRNKKFSAA